MYHNQKKPNSCRSRIETSTIQRTGKSTFSPRFLRLFTIFDSSRTLVRKWVTTAEGYPFSEPPTRPCMMSDLKITLRKRERFGATNGVSPRGEQFRVGSKMARSGFYFKYGVNQGRFCGDSSMLYTYYAMNRPGTVLKYYFYCDNIIRNILVQIRSKTVKLLVVNWYTKNLCHICHLSCWQLHKSTLKWYQLMWLNLTVGQVILWPAVEWRHICFNILTTHTCHLQGSAPNLSWFSLLTDCVWIVLKN